jgi:hypothetical protein
VLTAEDVARVYKTTVSYVRKRASLDQWRRIRHDGRIHYHPDDVDRSLGK